MRRYCLLLVLIFAFYEVLPLLRPGYIPTHDGEFSIIRVWQFSKVLASGNLLPRWAPDLNSGYGVPLFIFYYPLPYYFASIIHSIFSLVDSLKFTMALSYLIAATACFVWLRKIFNTKGATIGSLVFIAVPYWFVDIYIRGSVGEVMAIVWVMTSLVSVEYALPRALTLSVAALMISHNIEATLFLPVIILYVLLRKKQFLEFIILGLGLSSFFWLPALLEQKFVAGLSNFDFRDHFPEFAQLIIPSGGSGFSRPGWPSDEMSQQVGLVVWVVLLASPVFLLREKNIQYKRLIGSGLILSVIALFLMLDISIPVWQFVRPMKFIQYPWRLLSYFIPIAGLLGGYVAWRSARIWLPLTLGALALLLSFPYTHPVVYASRSDAYYLTRPEFTDGTTTVGNSFSTLWLPWQPKRSHSRLETSANVTISELKEQPTRYVFDLKAIGEGWVKLNISYFPGWTVTLDGKEWPMSEQSGVMRFIAPSGAHNVTVQFRDTPVRKTAGMVSVLSLFWLIGLGILGQDRYANRHRNVPSQERP